MGNLWIYKPFADYPLEMIPGLRSMTVDSKKSRLRRIVEKYLANGTLAYGLTTGLGARVSETLSYNEPDQNREPSIGRPQHRTR